MHRQSSPATQIDVAAAPSSRMMPLQPRRQPSVPVTNGAATAAAGAGDQSVGASIPATELEGALKPRRNARVSSDRETERPIEIDRTWPEQSSDENDDSGGGESASAPARGELPSEVVLAGRFLWKVPFHQPASPQQRFVRVERLGTLANKWGGPTASLGLVWSAGAKGRRRSVPLHAVVAIRRGHTTPAMEAQLQWSRQKDVRPELPSPDRCFSLVAADRTVDLVCASHKDREVWMEGLDALWQQCRRPLDVAAAVAPPPPRSPAGSMGVRGAQKDSLATGWPRRRWKQFLFDAIRGSDVQRVEWAMQRDCPLDLVESSRRDNAVMCACRLGYAPIVALCLQHGVSYDPHPDEGLSSVHLSAHLGRPACLEALLTGAKEAHQLDRVIDEVCRDARGRTPLLLAAAQGRIASLQVLLRFGANPRLRDVHGLSALHLAASGGLLPSTTHPSGDNDDASGQDVSASSGSIHRDGDAQDFIACLSLLLETGAEQDVDAGDRAGATALHVAAGSCQRASVQVLLESAASPLLVDVKGSSPQEWAAGTASSRMARKLNERADTLSLQQFAPSIVSSLREYASMAVGAGDQRARATVWQKRPRASAAATTRATGRSEERRSENSIKQSNPEPPRQESSHTGDARARGRASVPGALHQDNALQVHRWVTRWTQWEDGAWYPYFEDTLTGHVQWEAPTRQGSPAFETGQLLDETTLGHQGGFAGTCHAAEESSTALSGGIARGWAGSAGYRGQESVAAGHAMASAPTRMEVVPPGPPTVGRGQGPQAVGGRGGDVPVSACARSEVTEDRPAGSVPAKFEREPPLSTRSGKRPEPPVRPPPPPVATKASDDATAASMPPVASNEMARSCVKADASSSEATSLQENRATDGVDVDTSAYSRMLRVGLTLPQVLHKMEGDGVAAHVRDGFATAYGKSEHAESRPSASPKGELPEELQRFAKMLKMGVPAMAVRQKMMQEGMSEEKAAAALKRIEPSQRPQEKGSMEKDTTSTKTSQEDEVAAIQGHPVLQRFAKMKKVGIPLEAVRQKMVQENVSATDQHRFFRAFAQPHELAALGVNADAGESAASTTDGKPAVRPPPPPPIRAAERASEPTEGAQAAARRRNTVGTMKLHWKLLPEDRLENSVWADAASGEGGLTPSVSLGEEDLEELANMFAKKPSTGRATRRASAVPRPGSRRGNSDSSSMVQLLDFKRANNVGIALAQFRKFSSFRELFCAVISGSHDGLPAERLVQLEDILPTDGEMALCGSSSVPDAQLREPERFFRACSRVPRVHAKVAAVRLSVDMSDAAREVETSLSVFRLAVREVRESTRLREVLGMILVIGNVMNEGSSQGGARGITMDSLLKLTNTKSVQDKQTTLLDYLVSMAAKKEGGAELLKFTQDLPSVEDAKRILLTELRSEVGRLHQRVRQAEEEVDREQRELTDQGEDGAPRSNDDEEPGSEPGNASGGGGIAALMAEIRQKGNKKRKPKRTKPACGTSSLLTAEDRQSFLDWMRDFVPSARQRVTDLQREIQQASQDAHVLAEFFGEPPAQTPPERIFDVLSRFMSSFRRSEEAYQRRERAASRGRRGGSQLPATAPPPMPPR